MGHNGTHLTAPVKYAAKKTNSNQLEWYGNLPVGIDPDFPLEYNDFKVAGDYSTTNTTLTLVGTGTAAVGTATNVNGLLSLVTTNGNGPDSNNLQSKQLTWKLEANKKLWFESNVSISNVSDVDMFIGLSIASTTLLTATEYVGFRVTTGAATIAAQTCLASTITTVTTGQSAVAGTLVKLGFQFDQNVVKFYINRSYVGQSTTNLPTAALAVSANVTANSANARTMVIDYWFVSKER